MINDLRTLKEMLHQTRYIMDKKQKLQMFGLFFVILLGAGLETVGVSAVLPFIQSILTPEELLNNVVITKIVTIFKIVEYQKLPIYVGVVLILVYIVKNIYLLLSSYLQVKFRANFQKKLSTTMLSYFLKRPYEYFLNINSAEVLRGIQGDVVGTFIIIDHGFRFLSEALTACLIALYLFYTDWFMAAGVVFMSGLCFAIITIIFKCLLKGAGEKQRYAQLETNKIAYQTIGGIKEIKVMRRSKYFIEKYDEAYEGLARTTILSGSLNACPEKIIEAACVSSLIALVCIRIGTGQNAIEYISKLGIFAVAAFRILPCIARITGYISVFVYQRPTLEAVYKNLHEIKSKNQTQNNEIENCKQLKFEENINIEGVSWHYPNSEVNVLNDLTLTIQKGEVIGLIGESGAGKSTLADILLGLFTPQRGKITADGINIFTHQNEWAKTIGYVPQTIFLLDDTVRNNILFGAEDKDDTQIWKALEMAQCKEFIQQLPLELDTVVGERGVRFSGGQRQRIAIARALYYNPDILIMDEATSALDNETEKAVMEAVEALQGKKTLIIVAHRFSTLNICDEIYEIKNGKAILRKKENIVENVM